MCMLDEICAKQDEIYAIARAQKAEKLWAFGSCLRQDMDLQVRHVFCALAVWCQVKGAGKGFRNG